MKWLISWFSTMKNLAGLGGAVVFVSLLALISYLLPV